MIHRGGMCDCFSLSEIFLIKSEPKNTHDEVEFISVKALRVLLSKSHYLLCDWPVRFLEFNRRNNLMYSTWIMPRDVVPYWFSVVAKSHLRASNLSFR